MYRKSNSNENYMVNVDSTESPNLKIQGDMCSFENPHKVISNMDFFEKYKHLQVPSNMYGYNIQNMSDGTAALLTNNNLQNPPVTPSTEEPKKSKTMLVCGDIKTISNPNLAYQPISENMDSITTSATPSVTLIQDHNIVNNTVWPSISPKYTSYM